MKYNFPLKKTYMYGCIECMYVHVLCGCRCTMYTPSVCGYQKRVFASLELDLQTIVSCHVGTRIAASFLNYGDISLAGDTIFTLSFSCMETESLRASNACIVTFLGTVTTSLTESSMRGGMVYLAHGSGDIVHQGGEDMVAGARGSWLPCIRSQEEGRDACVLTPSCYPLCSVMELSPWEPNCISDGSSGFTQISLEIHSLTWLGVF